MATLSSDGITLPAPREWDGRVLSAGYIADYKPFNFVDGEGVRCSLYVSGCPFKCPDCYNQAAQSFRYGRPFGKDLAERILADLDKAYVDGLSLVGGEPFLATPVLIGLCRRVRERFGATKTIWIWSGYTYEQLISESDDKQELLGMCDVLVDGPFIKRLYHHDLAFRGSRNQRIIDLARSRAEVSGGRGATDGLGGEVATEFSGEVGGWKSEPVLWESGRRDSEGQVPFLTPAAPRS